MVNINNIFLELIRVSIGTQDALSRPLSEKEWAKMYEMAKKQSLVGICFAGIQRLGADADDGYAKIGLSEIQYFTWMGMSYKIQMRNEAMDGYTSKVLEYFRSKGFACSVLKGQGVARLYGAHACLRQSGDVDVWLSCTRKELYELSQKELGAIEGITYHHVHYNKWPDVDVEAHIHPSFLSSPIRNFALQKFCELNKPVENSGNEPCAQLCMEKDAPTLVFNRVFILLHCYRHFCGHGIGLRQLLDYYYVLLQGFSEKERKESMLWIDRLGMAKFCKATMWLMQEVFGMDKRYLLCEPDADNGKFLLEEVLRSGNFGRGDEASQISDSAVKRYIYNLKRDARTIRICPHESLWDPIFNIYQYVMGRFVWGK